MFYLDSHCHLNDEAFKDDLSAVLDSMVSASVLKAMIISCSVADYKKALEIKDPRIQFKLALGVYPEEADHLSEEAWEEYVSFMESKECCAIGEIGLDYHWYKETKQQQKEVFIRQIELAKKLDKPIIIHARDAYQDCFDILKKTRPERVVLHCYSGSAELAKEFVKLGCYISFAGPLTWKNAREPIEAVKVVPMDRILVETDSPYLTPVPFRGQRNDPSKVVYTARKAMEIKDVDEETFLAAVDANYERLFYNKNV